MNPVSDKKGKKEYAALSLSSRNRKLSTFLCSIYRIHPYFVIGTSDVTPVIAEIRGEFSTNNLKLNQSEVASVFVKTISELSDPKVRGYTQFRVKNSPGYTLPVYKTEPYRIWGLTAIITYQFLNVFLRRRGYRHKLHYQSPIKLNNLSK